MADEVGGQDIDVVLIGAHVRVVGGDSLEALVPERHGEDNAVGFCSRRQMLFAFAGLLEGVTDYSGYASAGGGAFLDGQFFGGAFVEAAAYVGIFAFAVLADDYEIDFAGLPVF